MDKAPIFKETYERYLAQIGDIDLSARATILGFEMEADKAKITCFNRTYRVNSEGIQDANGFTPSLSVCVILFKYLLRCPEHGNHERDLVTFKDFIDAAPLVNSFSNSVQNLIVKKFEGKIGDLENSCIRLGGKAYTADLAYQVKYQFWGLPKVPVYLLFNDAEEGFAGQCTILFERSAAAYLDMESLAMLGSALARWL